MTFISADQFGGGTGSLNGSYSVTFDIISNGGAGTSVFGGPVTFGTFTNAANNSGTGSAVLTQAITAGQSYKVVATVNDRYTRTGGTPALDSPATSLLAYPNRPPKP